MKETSMSSSIESSHNGPYFIMSDSDGSISNIRNPAFIPKESDRIVMVSAPSSDEDEEVSNAPPVAGESMELDGQTVSVEANNDGIVDLESDTDTEAPKRSGFDDGDTLPAAVQNMGFDGETVAVEANNDGVVDLESDTDLVVAKRSDFVTDDSSTDTLQLLLSLKDCCPESEAESELQILNTNFEAGGSSSRPDISTETGERTMQAENISIPEPMKDQQPTRTRALPPSRFISLLEMNKKPKAEKNLTSPVGEDGKSDVGKKNVIESEPVDPKGKKKPFSILEVLRQLAEEEEDMEKDKELCCLSLFEVAERRWGRK